MIASWPAYLMNLGEMLGLRPTPQGHATRGRDPPPMR